MADQKTNNKPTDPAATQAPLTSVYTNNLPAILDHFGISLAVSTYQAGKVILVRSDGGGIHTQSSPSALRDGREEIFAVQIVPARFPRCWSSATRSSIIPTCCRTEGPSKDRATLRHTYR